MLQDMSERDGTDTENQTKALDALARVNEMEANEVTTDTRIIFAAFALRFDPQESKSAKIVRLMR